MSDRVALPATDAIRACLVLAVVCAVHLAVSFAWFTREEVFLLPPRWDQAALLTKGLLAYQAGQKAGVIAWLKTLAVEYKLMELMLPATTGGLYFLLGTSQHVAYLTNLVYLWPLSCAVFLLAATDSGSRLAGWVAVWICFTLPGTIIFSREYSPEPVLAVWMALGLWCYVRSDRCHRLPWTIGAGTCLGLALLSRKTAAAYLAGPLLFAGWQVLTDGRPDARRRVTHALAAFGIGGVLAAIWYLPHGRGIVQHLLYYGTGEGSLFYVGDAPTWLERVERALRYGVDYGVGFGYTVIGLALLIWWTARMRRLWRQGTWTGFGVTGLCGTWLMISGAMLTISNVYAAQFFVPLLPPVAVLIGRGAARVWATRGRALVFGVLVLVGGMNYLLVQYGTSWLPSEARLGSVLLYSQLEPELQETKRMIGLLGRPATDWQQAQLLAAIEGTGHGGCRYVFVAVDHPFLNVNNVNYGLVQRGRTERAFAALRQPVQEQQTAIRYADCVVAKTRVPYPEAERFTMRWQDVLEGFQTQQGEWHEAGHWPLPDGADVVLFRRVGKEGRRTS